MSLRFTHFRLTLAPLAVLLAALAVAGCGSSKPGYCSQVSQLQKSVQDLTSTNVLQKGTSALQAQLTTIENQARATVNAAKSDFPSETSALSSSLNTLKASIDALPSSPTPQQIATVAGDAVASLTAAKNLITATQSKCK